MMAASAFAAPAQPVPIPEDPSVAPQVNISAVGIGTLGYLKSGEIQNGKGTLNFSDSAFQVGAAQSLFESSGVGSMQIGWLTTDDSLKDTGQQIFLHQAVADYQSEHFEAAFGRSDNPTSHLVDFPTLRGDDLVTLTNPQNPFSNGKNAEEHRYSNVASMTLNQSLKYFENIHAQHLITSADPDADEGLNSYGGTFGYLGEPGLENFERFPLWGLGYERIVLHRETAGAINQASVGALVSLNQSVTNRIEVAAQDIFSWGSSLDSLTDARQSFEADSNAMAASLRYLRSPFGRPSAQVSLTIAYKKYAKVPDANSTGVALTGVRHLGHGFDLVAQYLGQWRSSPLATVQTNGLGLEQRLELGLAMNFDGTFNEHIAPRRTLLNQHHGYLSQ